MAIVHRLAAGIFALCTVLQWNDPDPLAWMAVYGVATVLAVIAAEGRAPRGVIAGLAVVCVAWMALLVPGALAFARQGQPGLIAASMQAEQPWIEEAREFGGLAIVLAWCVAGLSTGRRPAAAAGGTITGS